MNLLSLLDTIGAIATEPANLEVTPTTPTTPTGRRAVLRTAGQAGVRALAAALPLAAVLPAAAAPAETTLDSLTLLLTLAELQAELYSKALATPGLVPGAAQPDLLRILQQQQQQAAYLRSLFGSAEVPTPATPAFDFSGSHNGSGPVLFPDVFSSFDSFLQLAQPLADAAARFYLGQLANLRAETPLLAAAVRRQAVEARQASHLRTLRRNAGALPKSWASPTDPAAAPALAFVQTGENNLDQIVPGTFTSGVFSGVRYINFYTLFPDPAAIHTSALAEAFDEPLPTGQATALLALFR